MGRRAKNKQGPPQAIDLSIHSAKRKADGYVPRSGGKKVKISASGKKIKGKHATVSRGKDRTERGMGEDSDEEGEEERGVEEVKEGGRQVKPVKGDKKAKAAPAVAEDK